MPILRLAYTTQFLIALIAIFVLWSQVGGQSHLDLLPWWVKLGLGLATAYSVVRATAASVSGDRAWNSQALRWLGLTLAMLAACGYASYYAHMNLEETDEEDPPQDTAISRMRLPVQSGIHRRGETGGPTVRVIPSTLLRSSRLNSRLVLGIEKPLLDWDHVPAFAQFAVWVAGIQLPVVNSVKHNLLRIHFSACSNRPIFSSETMGSQHNVTVVIRRISFIS